MLAVQAVMQSSTPCAADRIVWMSDLTSSTWVRTDSLSRVEFRSAEWICMVYFAYSFTLAVVTGQPLLRLILAALGPCAVCAVAAFVTWHSRPWSRVFRALFPTLLILLAYQ